MSASAVTAIVSRSDTASGPPQIVLRAEALTPAAAIRSGVLAWEVRLEVDCRSGQVRAGPTTGFVTRRGDSEPVAVAPAGPGWRKPAPGAALEAAWRAVCDPRFRPPLGTPAPAAVEPVSLQPAVAPAPLPARRGRITAQVVSSPAEADVRRRLAGLRERFAGRLAGLELRVEPARVRGRTVYRGVAAGFSTHGEARAFCQALRARGQDCVAH